jgi:hypothetical protein
MVPSAAQLSELKQRETHRYVRPGLPVFLFGRIPMSVVATCWVNSSGYQVTDSFPEGFNLPKMASAIDAPPDCPGYLQVVTMSEGHAK